jgi:hypothetical protein
MNLKARRPQTSRTPIENPLPRTPLPQPIENPLPRTLLPQRAAGSNRDRLVTPFKSTFRYPIICTVVHTSAHQLIPRGDSIFDNPGTPSSVPPEARNFGQQLTIFVTIGRVFTIHRKPSRMATNPRLT